MTEPRRGRQLRSMALAGLLLAPLPARADVAAVINTLRAQGCVGGASAPPLRADATLDQVAHALGQGLPLADALLRADYHAVSSFSVSISGVPPSGDVGAIISTHYCAQATNPVFREIGAWREGSRVWVALAEPFAPPRGADREAVGARVLELVNVARARARRCGGESFAAAAPLARDRALERIALAYAQDMARYAFMDHTGRDGSSPQQRISRAGYAWVEAGENLARGVMNADAVVEGWLGSPEHCANLMRPAYTRMGVAFAVNPNDAAGVYWAQEFARPLGR